MMQEKKIYTQNRIASYQESLKKLADTQETVEVLTKDMNKKKFEISKQQQFLADLVKDLNRKTKEITVEKKKQGEKNDKVQAEKDKADELKETARQQQLLKLQPVLDKAMAQVNELTSNTQDFNMVKEFARNGVPDVMLAMKPVMVLLDVSPVNDDSIKKEITKNFLIRVTKIAKKEELEKIDKEKMKKFEKHMKKLPHDLSNISGSLEVMRKFLTAISEFIKAHQDILPTLQKIELLTRKVEKMTEELKEGTAKLKKMEDETKILEDKKSAKESELHIAEAQIKEYAADLEIATSLVANLGVS